MKKSNIYLTLALGLITTIGCQPNEYNTFNDEYKAINIWIGNETTILDSTTFNYSYCISKDSLMFNARLIGTLSSEPITFTLEAYEGNTEEAAGAYQIGQYTFDANEYMKQFPIYFDPTKLQDSTLFKEQDGYLKFRLKTTNAINEGADKYQTIHVVLKNELAKPDTWDEAKYPNIKLSQFFGSYSEVKYKFIIQEVGAVDFKVSYNMSIEYDEATNTFASYYAKFLKNKLTLALEEYNATNPNAPLRDENGKLVTFN